MEEKVIYFHNIILPLIVFIICLSSIAMYGFTIRGLINFIVMIYSLYVVYSFDKHANNKK